MRSRERLQNMLLAIGGFLLAFLFCELILRLISPYSVNTRYLSNAGVGTFPPVLHTLDDLLQTKAEHMVSYRNWLNYSANALGFYDKEFEIPKPQGRSRIIALGDSYAYGLVSYPQSVMTLVENELSRLCESKEIDLLNFGIPATGVWEYEKVYKLAENVYSPDFVVIHFYLGNDGPDLLKLRDDLVPWKKTKFHSYLVTYLTNLFRLFRYTNTPKATAMPSNINATSIPTEIHPAETHAAGTYRAGELVDQKKAIISEAQGVLNEEGLEKVLKDELTRLYSNPSQKTAEEKVWKRVFQILSSLHQQIKEKKRTLVVILFPSQLQINDTERNHLIQRLSKKKKLPKDFSKFVDPLNPNRTLLQFCKEENIPCFDTTPYLREKFKNSAHTLYIPNDTHWNLLGNRFAAEVEASFLKSLVCPDENGSL